MASVNYYLKGAFSNDRLQEIQDKKLQKEILETPRQVYLNLSSVGVRLQLYTKQRVCQKDWNNDKQEVDCKKNRNGNGLAINNFLNSLRNDILNIATDNEFSSKQTSKKEIEKILSDKILVKTGSDETFDDYFKSFISQHKTSTGHSLRENTMKKYNGLSNHLKAFSIHSKTSLNVKLFDKDFLESFRTYLIKEMGHNDNTVSKYIKAIKPFIRYYMAKGVIGHYSLGEIKSVEREGEVFVLPLKQILELQNLAFIEDRLKSARDIFCFMCWTGQRFSDYQVLTHDDFSINEKGEKVWKLITIKTDAPISVPIIHYAQKILDKYVDHLYPLPRLSNQKMNQYLKEIGASAKFNHTVKIVKYFDGKKKEVSVPFYHILTTHVARKSFITNSLILGVPERVVKEVSGHKDEKSFRRYVKLADNYKSDLIHNAFSAENINKLFLKTV